ncbi:FecR family protein [Maribacter sp.]|uniref:FecR family protein n=1 Tax=Maribacter sp. TaxID=1897614 RepID=UPI0025BC2A63|nr:FecR family protein [Maribacter sp.]
MKLIINKYLQGSSNKLEERKLYNWLSEDENNIQIFKEEITYYMLNDSRNEIVDAQEAFEEFKEFKESIKKRENKQVHIFSYKKYYKYAAAVAILVSSIYFINNSIESKDKNTNQVSKNIKPSNNVSNEIILTLNDGSTQLLDKDKEELSYIDSTSEELLAYNEIKTPKGQIFRLVLSDSTVVWLNADTKIKYPKKFVSTLKTRTVILEGEAFFDVAHNKDIPFVVYANGIDIKVLGTKFNVSSYANDQFINTTLVEGSVNVVDTNDTNNSIILEPSFQASYQKTNMVLTSKEVNTLDYTSWIQKIIIFNDTPFESLITKIERTYNVEIINENEQIKNERFTGQFDIENIETIFKALSSNFHFEYEINNNKITIKN